MVTGENTELIAMLTPPLALESGTDDEYRAPNLIKCILSLFKNVRPGSDLTRFQLPPLFNLPKSQLQCFGETVYCIGDDMLSKCAKGQTPLERFTAVVAWSLSSTRPVLFGVAPFNPILGETHHVSRGSLNLMLEQVSHHPPVSALHATDEKENVEMIWCHQIIPNFYGTSVEGVVHGKRLLKLLNHGENYVLNSPKLVIRLLPVPGTEWAGNVTIQCEESDLSAELHYKGQSLLGFRGNSRSVQGKIFETTKMKTLYEINGHWDKTVTLKDTMKGDIKVLYDGKETLSRLKIPVVKDIKGLRSSESAVVWNEVSQAILRKEWDKAREAKNALENKERQLRKERNSKGEIWVPKHFNVSCSKEGVWECSPKETCVRPAPIIAPF